MGTAAIAGSWRPSTAATPGSSGRILNSSAVEAGYSRTVFKEKLERDGEIRGLETTWKKRDGTPIDIRESARAIRAKDGSLLYYEGTVEDVSERKKIEEALRASEEKYRNSSKVSSGTSPSARSKKGPSKRPWGKKKFF